MVGKWTFLFKWFFFRIFKGGSIKYYCIYCVCVYISTCICIHSSIRFPASHRQRQELEQMRHKFNSEASQNRRSFREMGGWRGGMCVKLKPHGKWWFLEESCQELCGKKVEICGFVFFDSKSSGRKRDGCYGFCSVWKQDVSNPELIILIIAKKSCVP